MPGNTVAFLSVEDLLRTQEFIVGDDRTYGGYHNAPLDGLTEYTIYFVVASSLDGVTRFAFSQLVEPVITGPTPPTTEQPTTTEDPGVGGSGSSTKKKNKDDDDSTIIIIIVVVILLVILIIVILLIVCWFLYRRNRRDR